MRFNNYSASAAWKRQVYSPSEWWRRQESLHYIFELKGISVANVEPDELHILHLGTSAYLAGSCLWLLTYEVLPASPKENLGKVWSLILEPHRRNTVGTSFNFIVADVRS